MRSVAREHLKHDHAQGIEVGLERVEVPPERLWSHVERSANIDSVLEAKASLGCKSKITDFPFIADPKYVGGFDVPVNNSLGKKESVGRN